MFHTSKEFGLEKRAINVAVCFERSHKNKWNFTCMQGQRLWSWLPKWTCSQLLGPSPGLCQNAYPIVAQYWLPGFGPLTKKSIDLRVIFVQKFFEHSWLISKDDAGCFNLWAQEFLLKFLKNSAAVWSNDKILTGKVKNAKKWSRGPKYHLHIRQLCQRQ